MPAFLAAIPAWILSTAIKALLEWLAAFIGKETAEAAKRAEEKRIAEDNLKKYNEAVAKGDLDEIAKAAERMLNRSSN